MLHKIFLIAALLTATVQATPSHSVQSNPAPNPIPVEINGEAETVRVEYLKAPTSHYQVNRNTDWKTAAAERERDYQKAFARGYDRCRSNGFAATYCANTAHKWW